MKEGTPKISRHDLIFNYGPAVVLALAAAATAACKRGIPECLSLEGKEVDPKVGTLKRMLEETLGLIKKGNKDQGDKTSFDYLIAAHLNTNALPALKSYWQPFCNCDRGTSSEADLYGGKMGTEILSAIFGGMWNYLFVEYGIDTFATFDNSKGKNEISWYNEEAGKSFFDLLHRFWYTSLEKITTSMKEEVCNRAEEAKREGRSLVTVLILDPQGELQTGDIELKLDYKEEGMVGGQRMMVDSESTFPLQGERVTDLSMNGFAFISGLCAQGKKEMVSLRIGRTWRHQSLKINLGETWGGNNAWHLYPVAFPLTLDLSG